MRETITSNLLNYSCFDRRQDIPAISRTEFGLFGGRRGLYRLISPDSEQVLSTNSTLPRETPPFLGLCDRLQVQRRKAETLLAQAEALRSRGASLRFESNLLCGQIGRLWTALARTLAASNGGLREFGQFPNPGGTGSTPGSLRLADLEDYPPPQDLVAALEDATQILRMEFQETEGSGRQTLRKCERALRRAQSARTVILPLY